MLVLKFDTLRDDIRNFFAKIKLSTDDLSKQNELLISRDLVADQIVNFIIEISIFSSKIDLFNSFKKQVSHEISQAIKLSLLEFKNELPISPSLEREHLVKLCDVFEPIIQNLYISKLEENYKSCDFQTLNLNNIQSLVPNLDLIGECIRVTLASLQSRVSSEVYDKIKDNLLENDYSKIDEAISDDSDMNELSVNFALNELNIKLTAKDITLEHGWLSKKLNNIRIVEIIAAIENKIYVSITNIHSYADFYKKTIDKHNEYNIIRARMALDDTNISMTSINANTYAFIVSKCSMDFRNRFLNGDGKPVEVSSYSAHPLLTSGAMTEGEALMLILNAMTNTVAFSNDAQVITNETPSVSPRLSAVSNFSPRMLQRYNSRNIHVDDFSLNQKTDAAASLSDEKTTQESSAPNKRQSFSNG